jgi:CubicO group peptidase (beta-lactamase class C family)
MTKPVTSIAIMMLREQRLLELDDSIGEYVPDLVGREVIGLRFTRSPTSNTLEEIRHETYSVIS